MKKWLLLCSAFLITIGCQKELETNQALADQISVHIHQPEEMQIIDELQFDIAGEIEWGTSKNRTFFYQIEDGHGYLATGELPLQENGQFQKTVSILNPTNPVGAISVYVDSNEDGVFELGIDQKIYSNYMLSFDESIQVPLSLFSEEELSSVDQEDNSLETGLLDTIRKEVYEHAESLRDNWRMEWEQFASQKLTAYVVDEHYILTWVSDGVGESVLTVFEKDQQKWQAVFSELIGRDVTDVRLIELMDNRSLVAVESYYASGVGEQSAHTNLYLIDGGLIKNVWDIKNASRTTIILDNGLEEETRINLAYSIPPMQLQLEPEIIIYVYGEQTVVKRNETELISKEVFPINKTYTFVENEQRFIEQ